MHTFITIVLALTCVWLGYQLYFLRRGISDLVKALGRDSQLQRPDLPPSANRGPLEKLSKDILDTLAESNMQQALAEGVQRIQKVLLDEVDDALFIVDEYQQVRFANTASRRLFKARDMVGRQLIEVCLDHHIVETVDLALNAQGPVQDQFHLGKDRTLFVESGPIDPSYRIGAGAWIIIRDITEQLRTERIRQDFVANASHELRTPLSIIKGYLEMLDENNEYSDPVRVMLKHTNRLSRIVEDMLTISKLESTEVNALQNKSVFDIGDCIISIIDHLQPVITDQKAKIKFDFPEEEDRNFFGDRFYWDQVFFNLVENALKQNPTPGLKVTIRVVKNAATGWFTIEVIDDGVGIPEADITEIFKRFYQVDKTHGKSVKGTGLGLSIVKRAVEAHDGVISVKSQPGHRTCFTISVPGSPVGAPQQS